MAEFLHLRSFAADGASLFLGRVGSIISKERPAFALAQDTVLDGLNAPKDFEAQFDALKDQIRNAARSVGRIETNDAVPIVMATCFRVGADPHRVATARHVAAALLKEGAKLKPGENPAITGVRGKKLRQLFVVFEGNNIDQEERIEIAAIELSHGAMDLMLLRLETPSVRPPLALSAPLPLEKAENAEVCIIGYPVSEPSASDKEKFEAVFKVGNSVVTGIKRASPGLLGTVSVPPDPALFSALHDATTLPGSSGSPVISLLDGLLIGLHYRGKTGRDRNTMIYLPSALTDPALLERLDDNAPEIPVTPFPIWAEDEDTNVVTGRPLTAKLTAEEMNEAATPPSSMHASAAPNRYAQAPAILLDRRDIRDRYYAPPLGDAKSTFLPDASIGKGLRRQELFSDCAGCALSIAIENSLAKLGRDTSVSARMLYEMACLHDEFLDDLPSGTSLRGAIKGLFHNGVCVKSDLDEAPDWFLSVDRAKEAREIALGAYYRLRPSLPDFQMAVQVTGAVVVSAWTHPGWRKPLEGHIAPKRERCAAHAFVLVGYDQTGFIIQNSWGENWCKWKNPETNEEIPGLAHWSYADWAETVMDAWVLQIAPPAPTAHNLPLRAYQNPDEPQLSPIQPEIIALPEPRRMAIIGHVAHVERAGLINAGRVGVGPQAIRETALYLSSERSWTDPAKKYTDIAFIFHDPTMGAESAARLAAHLIPRFKAARIYPLNIFYGVDEIRSLTARMTDEARLADALTAKSGEALTTYLDRRATAMCGSILASFLDGIDEVADVGGPLWSVLGSIGIEAAQPKKKKWGSRCIHVVGFGAGSLVAHACFGSHVVPSGYSISEMSAKNPASVSLLAPIARPGVDIDDPAFWSPFHDLIQPRMCLERLGPSRPFSYVLDRYSGDWPDLLSGMIDHGALSPRSSDRRSRNPVTLSAIATNPEMLNGILKNIVGAAQLNEWATF